MSREYAYQGSASTSSAAHDRAHRFQDRTASFVVNTLGRSGPTSHASSAKPMRGYRHRVTEAIPVGHPECGRFRRDDPGRWMVPRSGATVPCIST
jgi:hypothetical protein